ncbi:GNAT family N-acetyltransferase [candidate division WOR-3 bacterium]|nr:GNAT family N-acetyltransferase [candidate division WOR-3 bacterium]
MKVKILRFEDISPTEWNNLVMNSKNGTVFNTIEWIKVWNSGYQNATPLFLILPASPSGREADGIKAGIPVVEIRKGGFKNYYSLPYGGYGGVLTIHENEKETKKLLSSFAKLAKGRWGMLALTDFYDNLKEEFWEPLGFKKIQCTTHILPLFFEPQNIWRNFLSSKIRNQVRQSQKMGVKVSLVKSKNEIVECHKMLKETVRRHKKVSPELTFKFYLNLFRTMGKFLRWTIAQKGDIFLAYAIHFVYKDTIIWWDNASYTNGLQYRPNNALIWETIQWGCEKGYKYYNLGSSPQNAPGLVKFKEGWGAEKKVYCTYYKKSFLFKTLKSFKNEIIA